MKSAIQQAEMLLAILILLPCAGLAAAEKDFCSESEVHVEVDTGSNQLYLKCGQRILFEAVCSTGSGKKLTFGDKTWVFRTPKGRFAIESIVEDPVWRRPDWAFLEEGESVPLRESERYLENALGEFALSIGRGYFIHGTLYERLLGQNVTHGCIRLGREDLEFVVRNVRVGTPVIIF